MDISIWHVYGSVHLMIKAQFLKVFIETSEEDDISE